MIDTTASAGGGSISVILAEVCKLFPAGDSSGNGYYAVDSGQYETWARQLLRVSQARARAGDKPFSSHFSSISMAIRAAIHRIRSQGTHRDWPHWRTSVDMNYRKRGPIRTNPGAWYDASGQENGDKCAWTFNVPLITFSNGTRWSIQGEWSNAAYDSGTGYPNSSGQNGCLDGH